MLGHSGRTAGRYPPGRPADVGCCVGRDYRDDARRAREGELEEASDLRLSLVHKARRHADGQGCL